MSATRVLCSWLALGVLAGCDSQPAAAPNVASTTPKSTATAPDTPPPAEPPKSGSGVTPLDPVQQSSKAGDNPNRINQLRELKKVDIKAGDITVHAWIMDNESKRAEGMMFLTDKDVKEDQGMIFVFAAQQPARNTFWMHNCPLGLDIVYIDAKRKVVNVGDGKPQNDDPVAANGDYWYVLEVKRGWSKRHHLKAGDPVGVPKSLTTLE